MAVLKIKTEAKTLGEAQNFLRGVISLLNVGIKDGKGWIFGEGDIEKEPEQIRAKVLHPILQDLTLQLESRIGGDVEGLEESDRKLLLNLSKALYEVGYGTEIEPIAGSSQGELGKEVGGADDTKVVEPGNEALGAPHGLSEDEEKEALAKGRQFPWEK